MTKVQNAKTKASDFAFNRSIEFEYGVLREIAPGVRRLVANNPGPFTYTGTNTYVVGKGEVAVIDPGPDQPGHLDDLLAALKGEKISYILLTHTHRDHSDLLAPLQAATGAHVMGYGPTDVPRGFAEADITNDDFIEHNFTPDTRLRTGDTVKGKTWALDVIHTPGHAPDHLCFALQGKRMVFTGDHIMGWNTTVIAPPEGHMGAYIGSLERLLDRYDIAFFPGHGGQIKSPRRVVRAYLTHRKWREATIRNCLEEGLEVIPQIVPRIYANLDPNLFGAAALSVLAHLEHLVEREVVVCDGPPSTQAVFSLL